MRNSRLVGYRLQQDGRSIFQKYRPTESEMKWCFALATNAFINWLPGMIIEKQASGKPVGGVDFSIVIGVTSDLFTS